MSANVKILIITLHENCLKITFWFENINILSSFMQLVMDVITLSYESPYRFYLTHPYQP